MATEVLIPKLGMTMTEGTVAEWLVPDGAVVRAGDMVYRLETEKIEFQVEAEMDGLVRQAVPAGTTLPPGSVVGYILAPGEEAPAGTPARAAVGAGAAWPAGGGGDGRTAARLVGNRIAASPVARRLANEAGLSLAEIAGSGPGGRITEADVLAARAAAPAASALGAPAGAEHILASPIARRLAGSLGIDLAQVRGTGPNGRVTKEDVEAAATGRRSEPAAGSSAPTAGTIVPMRGMRRVIAERMRASLQEMAQLTMTMDVAMDECSRLRSQLIDEWAEEGVRPSFTDVVIKAAAKSLRRHRLLNARVTAEGIELEAEVHVGVAVALDDGLVVPVIRQADALSLKELARESRRLADAARSGSLGLDDMSGQTFSVTALGSAGIDVFTPIINPPNVAILGVGRIRDGLGWDGDRPVRRSILTLSLTIDHRAVDGAPGAAFLGDVRALLEAPYRLLV